MHQAQDGKVCQPSLHRRQAWQPAGLQKHPCQDLTGVALLPGQPILEHPWPPYRAGRGADRPCAGLHSISTCTVPQAHLQASTGPQADLTLGNSAACSGLQICFPNLRLKFSAAQHSLVSHPFTHLGHSWCCLRICIAAQDCSSCLEVHTYSGAQCCSPQCQQSTHAA